MRKAFWSWLHLKLMEWMDRVYWNKLRDPSQPTTPGWTALADWPTESKMVESVTYREPLSWGETPALCTCMAATTASSSPMAAYVLKRITDPTCPIHGERPCQPSN